MKPLRLFFTSSPPHSVQGLITGQNREQESSPSDKLDLGKGWSARAAEDLLYFLLQGFPPLARCGSNVVLILIASDGRRKVLSSLGSEVQLHKAHQLEDPIFLAVCEGDFEIDPGAESLRRSVKEVVHELSILFPNAHLDSKIVELRGGQSVELYCGDDATGGVYFPQFISSVLLAKSFVQGESTRLEWGASFHVLSLCSSPQGKTLVGWVENSGSVSWPCGSLIGSVRVGIHVYIGESSEAEEFRSDFTCSMVAPGCGEFFSITLPSEWELLVLDVVKEGEFWFSLKDSRSERLELMRPTLLGSNPFHPVLRPCLVNYVVIGKDAEALVSQLSQLFAEQDVDFVEYDGRVQPTADLLYLDLNRATVSVIHVIEMIRLAYDRRNIGPVGLPLLSKDLEQIIVGATRGPSGLAREFRSSTTASGPSTHQRPRVVDYFSSFAVFLRASVMREQGITPAAFFDAVSEDQLFISMLYATRGKGFIPALALVEPPISQGPTGIDKTLAVAVAKTLQEHTARTTTPLARPRPDVNSSLKIDPHELIEVRKLAGYFVALLLIPDDGLSLPPKSSAPLRLATIMRGVFGGKGIFSQLMGVQRNEQSARYPTHIRGLQHHLRVLNQFSELLFKKSIQELSLEQSLIVDQFFSERMSRHEELRPSIDLVIDIHEKEFSHKIAVTKLRVLFSHYVTSWGIQVLEDLSCVSCDDMYASLLFANGPISGINADDRIGALIEEKAKEAAASASALMDELRKQ